MLQVILNLRNTLGSVAWIMIALLLISAIFLGYYVMRRLLRRDVSRSSRRFLLERRFLPSHLQKH